MPEDTPEVLPAVGPKKGRGPARNQNLKFERQQAEVVELAAKGLTVAQIAGAVDLSEKRTANILERFSKVFTALPRAREYREMKAEILSAGELAALESAFSGTKLAKAGFLSTLQGFEILAKHRRLEVGQSTENISHQVLGTIEVNHLGTQGK